jgi:uncharacterized protein
MKTHRFSSIWQSRPLWPGTSRRYHPAPASKIRNPKPEGREKAESRNPKSEKPALALLLARIESLPAGAQASPRGRSRFALRISDFGLLSAFGFRVSGFRPVAARGGGTHKIRPLWPVAAALALAALTAGCSFLKPAQNETRYYLLTPASPVAARTHTNSSTPGCVVRLRPVEVADYLNTVDMAVRTGPNQIHFALFHCWAEPLDAGIRRVLAEDLTATPLVRQVLTDQPAPPGRPVYTLSIRVLACEGVSSTNHVGSTAFAAAWQIVDSGAPHTILAHGVFRAQPGSWTPGDYAQLAGQLSRAVADFSNVLLDALSQHTRSLDTK